MPRWPKVFVALGLLLAGAGAGMLLADWSRAEPDQAGLAVTTHGEWVAFPNADGDTIRAYVAYPERQGRAPAVIVIHEIFGMTDWEPTVADRFAANGYVAIAPDLLSARFGSTAAAGDSARRMVSQLTAPEVRRDLDATYAYVNGLAATASDQVGVIGFCWGGGSVWTYASHNPRLKAAVVCYGPLADTAMLATVEAPVLGVYGENDGRINNALPDVARRMAALGKPFTADSYPGTGHGFLKPGRNGHGTPSEARAWADIDGFFARELGP